MKYGKGFDSKVRRISGLDELKINESNIKEFCEIIGFKFNKIYSDLRSNCYKSNDNIKLSSV